MQEKTYQPHEDNQERAVVAMLSRNPSLMTSAPFLRATDFYCNPYRVMFESIQRGMTIYDTQGIDTCYITEVQEASKTISHNEISFVKSAMAVSENSKKRILILQLNNAIQNLISPLGTYAGTVDTINQGIKSIEELHPLINDDEAELEACLFDTTDDTVPEPKWMYEINGTKVIPQGGIIAISGEAKKGKSHYISLLIARAIKGQDEMGITPLFEPKNILWIDTEQQEYTLHSRINRVFEAAGLPKFYDASRLGIHILRLRAKTDAERRRIMRNAINRFHSPENPIQIIIIDGIRDLIKNINDVDESNNLISELMAITNNIGCAIFSVLHVNHGSDKLRGTVGTELTNKMDENHSVDSDGHGNLIVKHDSREMRMDDYKFRIEKNGYSSTDSAPADPNVKAFVTQSLTIGESWNIFNELGLDEAYTRKELTTMLSEHIKLSRNMTDKEAKDMTNDIMQRLYNSNYFEVLGERSGRKYKLKPIGENG